MIRGLKQGVAVLACLSVMIFVLGCKKEEPERQAGAQSQPATQQSGEALLCYVGGTIRPALEEIGKLYKAETGQEVIFDTADSGDLIVRIETEKKGDLFVCHDPFLTMLMDHGLGAEGWVIATFHPVIVVPKGNPKGIHGLQDLAKPGMSLIVTNEYSTLGHLLPIMFKKAGVDFDKLKETNIKKMVRSGSEAANNVVIGNFDAALCWNAVAALRSDKLDAIAISPEHLPVPGVDAVTSATGKVYDVGLIKVTIATLKCSTNLDQATKFSEYVASPKGAAVFAKLGYSPVPADLMKPIMAPAGK